MNKRMLTFCRIAALLAGLLAIEGAVAEDAPVDTVSLEAFPDFILRRLQLDRYGDAVDRLDVPQGIISGAKQWDTKSPITVCFFGGSPEVRRKIVATAASWELPGTTVKFDFGNRNDPRICSRGEYSQIRVGYSLPGYWSFVGQDSIWQSPQHEQSLNLEGFDWKDVGEAEHRRVVLHEFGHALGLQHEHQHPDADCQAEYDWPAIYEYMAGPPNRWDKDKVNNNMRARRYYEGDVANGFDINSIMLYSFPSKFYVRGTQSKCYSPLNTTLSRGDAEVVAMAYGVGSNRQEMAIETMRSALPRLSEEEQRVVRSRLDFFEADDDTKARTIGIVRGEYIDIDLFACDNNPATQVLYREMAKIAATQPYLGTLRARTELFPDDQEFDNGITLVADLGHPEVGDARRIAESIEGAYPGRVKVAANTEEVSRWYLSMVACAK